MQYQIPAITMKIKDEIDMLPTCESWKKLQKEKKWYDVVVERDADDSDREEPE